MKTNEKYFINDLGVSSGNFYFDNRKVIGRRDELIKRVKEIYMDKRLIEE